MIRFDFAFVRPMATLLAACLFMVSSARGEDLAAGLGKVRGDPSARVVIIEYLSPTCGACKRFHDVLEPGLEKNFIDTGKVRFEQREYLRNDVDTAIASLARCSGNDADWHRIIADAFDSQGQILAASRNGTVKSVLLALALRNGIKDEAGFNACLANVNTRFDLAALSKSAIALNVEATPTLLINDAVKITDADFDTPETFTAYLNKVVSAATTGNKQVR
jgi:protein-disulfide isomerase